MSTLETITIPRYDGDVTPLVFTPVRQNGNTVTLTAPGLIALSEKVLHLTLSRATASRKSTRINVNYAHPIERTFDSVVSAEDVARYNKDGIVLPANMSEAEQTEFHYVIMGIISSDIVKQYVSKREPML